MLTRPGCSAVRPGDALVRRDAARRQVDAVKRQVGSAMRQLDAAGRQVDAARGTGCHVLCVYGALGSLTGACTRECATCRKQQLHSASVQLLRATLSTPAVEPGLSWPQRDVLTTRRCGHLLLRAAKRQLRSRF